MGGVRCSESISVCVVRFSLVGVRARRRKEERSVVGFKYEVTDFWRGGNKWISAVTWNIVSVGF